MQLPDFTFLPNTNYVREFKVIFFSWVFYMHDMNHIKGTRKRYIPKYFKIQRNKAI